MIPRWEDSEPIVDEPAVPLWEDSTPVEEPAAAQPPVSDRAERQSLVTPRGDEALLARADEQAAADRQRLADDEEFRAVQAAVSAGKPADPLLLAKYQDRLVFPQQAGAPAAAPAQATATQPKAAPLVRLGNLGVGLPPQEIYGLVSVLGDDSVPTERKLLRVFKALQASPEARVANADYINRLRDFLSNLATQQINMQDATVAAQRAKDVEDVLRPIYLAVKGYAGGWTLGASDIALNKLEKRMGGAVEAEGIGESFLSGASRLAGGVATGQGIARGIGGVLGRTGIGTTAQMLGIRVGTALLSTGANQINGLLAGTVKPDEVAGNIGQNIGASLAALVPAYGIPKGAANSAGQVVTDFVYDLATDLWRGRVKPGENFTEWFLQTELPQLVNSVVFATMDYTDKDFERNRQRVKADLRRTFSRDFLKQKLGMGQPPVAATGGVDMNRPAAFGGETPPADTPTSIELPPTAAAADLAASATKPVEASGARADEVVRQAEAERAAEPPVVEPPAATTKPAEISSKPVEPPAPVELRQPPAAETQPSPEESGWTPEIPGWTARVNSYLAGDRKISDVLDMAKTNPANAVWHLRNTARVKRIKGTPGFNTKTADRLEKLADRVETKLMNVGPSTAAGSRTPSADEPPPPPAAETQPTKVPTGETQRAGDMTYEQLRDELTSATDKQSLDRIRPLLAEVFPEYAAVDFRDPQKDPWGIGRAIQSGDELPRIPMTDLSVRHRRLSSSTAAPASTPPPAPTKQAPAVKAGEGAAAPLEATGVRAGVEAARKPPELMTPEEAGVTPSEPPVYPPRSEKQRFGPKGYANATPEQIAQHKAELKAYRQAGQRAKDRTTKSNAHWGAVEAAVRDGNPINAESFEWRYPSEKPEGYTRSGDRYVFKPAAPAEPAREPGVPAEPSAEPATPVGKLKQKMKGKKAAIKSAGDAAMDAAVEEASVAVESLDTFGATGRLSAENPKLRMALGKIAKKHGVSLDDLVGRVVWQAVAPPPDAEKSTIELGREAVAGEQSDGVATRPPGYLDEKINYGGEQRTRGSVIAEMQKAGAPQKQIDAYMMGAQAVETPPAISSDRVETGVGMSVRPIPEKAKRAKAPAFPEREFAVVTVPAPNKKYKLYEIWDVETGLRVPSKTINGVNEGLALIRNNFNLTENGIKYNREKGIFSKESLQTSVDTARANQPPGPGLRGGPGAAAAEGEAGKRGFVAALPIGERLRDVARQTVDWLKLRFTSEKGQSADWNAIADEARRRGNMFNIHQQTVANRVRTAVKTLSQNYNVKAVQDGVNAVLDGTKTLDDFRTTFRLAPADPVVKELEWVMNDRERMSGDIADNLDKQGKRELAQTVRDNRGTYLTRFYLRHIMGDNFVPEKADFDAAVDAVKTGLSEQLGRLSKSASRLGRVMGKASGAQAAALPDAVRYLDTGDEAMIAGLNDRQQAFARLLKDRFWGVKSLVDRLDVDPAQYRRGKPIEAMADVAALDDAAKDTVDYLLSGDRETGRGVAGPIDVNHLLRRTLAPVFRQLYQEVGTPVERIQKTADVQGNMLVGLETVNKIYEQGAGRWWSKGAPDKQRGLMVRLQGRQFGKLDGAFVSKATSELLNNAPRHVSRVMRAYENIVGYQRTIQVATSLPTTERNLLSGYASFATGSGDVFIEPAFGARASYHKNISKALAFLTKLAKAKKGSPEYTELLGELERIAALDVFHARESGVSADIMVGQTGLKMPPEGLVGRLFAPLGTLREKVGKTYAYGDFITKYASFLTQKELGKTDAEAAEHVRKFYQHPSSLPTGLRAFSKLPFADYPTYFFDSVRIKKNQLQNAVKSATDGDVRPLIGFAISNALYALGSSAVAERTGKLIQLVKGKLGDTVEDEQLQAIKEFQPDYWQNKPMVASIGKDKDGKPVLDYVIAGNIMAFPMDDAIVGMLQSGRVSGGIDELVDTLFKSGMTWQTVSRLLIGQEVGRGASYYKTKGLVDFARSEDPDKTFKMMDAVVRAAIQLGAPLPRRVQNSFARWGQINEKLAAKKITEADANEQRWDIIMSEVLPIKTRSITRSVAHNMIYNTLKPEVDTIQELDREIGRGMRPDATATEREKAQRALKNIGILYRSVIGKVSRGKKAFRQVYSEKDWGDTLIDLFGSQEVGLSVNRGLIDNLLRRAAVPSTSARRFKSEENKPLTTTR